MTNSDEVESVDAVDKFVLLIGGLAVWAFGMAAVGLTFGVAPAFVVVPVGLLSIILLAKQQS
jgi:hypothetical protein